MAGDDLCFLGIAEAGRLFKARKLSPVELTQAFLARIKKLDSQVDSFITVTEELALKQAREAEAEIASGRSRGPMHGIPYTLKDIIDTKGILTTSCSRLDAERVPDADATCATKLHEGGAVLLGKVSCQEFASNGPCFDLPWPPARNPWNRDHSPAGSSSGSGAAVAAGFCMGSVGTDTGGSIRNPSSYCGLAGIKPTYGRVSRRGVTTNSWTLDHIGPLTWTVEDCALMLQPMSGYDEEDPGSANEPVPDFTAPLARGIKGAKIGWARKPYEVESPANEEVRGAMSEAARVLKELGATVEEIDLLPMQDYADAKRVIGQAEFYAVHEKDFQERFDQYGRNIWLRHAGGGLVRAVDYIQAQRKRLTLIRQTNEILKGYDAVITANQYGPAPKMIPGDRDPNRLSPTGTFNLTGNPALAVCIGFAKNGLPLSMQVVAKHFDEASAFRVGHAYEKATAWRSQRPAMSVKAAAE
jgi:aspartyl-tRNA(Asn)/glutamyl-tRNA(Gln) amidotransferase subunit A